MPLGILNRAKRNSAILEKFYDETNITRTGEGSVARALFDAIHSEMEAIEDRLDEAVVDSNPLTATGPHLQLWSSWFGLDRNLTLRAHAREEDQVVRLTPGNGASTFGDLNNGNPITLSSSEFRALGRTQLVTDTGVEDFEVEYELYEDITLAAGDSEQYIGVIATQPGVESNIGTGQLRDHTFQNYTTHPDIKLVITNLMPIANGEDEEDDEQLQYRLSRLGFLRPNDIIEKISNKINQVPGVTDVIALEQYSGSGSVDFFIDSQSFEIPDTLLNEAQDAASEVNSRGTLINVDAISRVGLFIELTIKFKTATTAEARASILSDIELQIMNDILSVNINESLDLEDLFSRLSLAYNAISSLGSTGKGFDSVVVYRDSLYGQRVGETLTDTLSVIQLTETERLLPEDSLTRSILVKESTR